MGTKDPSYGSVSLGCKSGSGGVLDHGLGNNGSFFLNLYKEFYSFELFFRLTGINILYIFKVYTIVENRFRYCILVGVYGYSFTS